MVTVSMPYIQRFNPAKSPVESISQKHETCPYKEKEDILSHKEDL